MRHGEYVGLVAAEAGVALERQLELGSFSRSSRGRDSQRELVSVDNHGTAKEHDRPCDGVLWRLPEHGGQ